MKNAVIIIMALCLLLALAACKDKPADTDKTDLGETIGNALNKPKPSPEDDGYPTGGMVSENTELSPLEGNLGDITEFSFRYCESGYRYDLDFDAAAGNTLAVTINEDGGEKYSVEISLDAEQLARFNELILGSKITDYNGYSVIKGGIDPDVGEMSAYGTFSGGAGLSVSCNAGDFPPDWEEVRYRLIKGIKEISGYNDYIAPEPCFADRLIGVWFCPFPDEDDMGYTLSLLGKRNGMVFGEVCEGGYSYWGIIIIPGEGDGENAAACRIVEYSDGLGADNWHIWNEGVDYTLELSEDESYLSFFSADEENAYLSGMGFEKIASDALSYDVGERTAYAEELFENTELKASAFGDRTDTSLGNSGEVLLSLREDGLFLYADLDMFFCPVVYTGRYFFSGDDIVFDAARVGAFKEPILSTAKYTLTSPFIVLLSDENPLAFSSSDALLFEYLGNDVTLNLIPEY